jgi:CRISPR-associated protein Cmr3
MTTANAHLAIVPRDGFFAKDGRGWHTSASGRGHSLDWPWPSTVLGALRTAWGRGEEARSNSIFAREDWRLKTASVHLGRTLVLRRKLGVAWDAEHTTWPVPLDALWLEGRREVHRLEPVRHVAPTLGRDDDEAREGLLRPVLDDAQKPLAAPRWWTNNEFSAWLAGHSVSVRAEKIATTRRVQAHVGIRPEELTADDGVLFSHDVIETLDSNAEWALGVEVAMPPGKKPDVLTLGADSRLARIESLPLTLFEPPAQVLSAFRTPQNGIRLVAVTPLSFSNGWLPEGFTQRNGSYCGRLAGLEVVLRAAYVPRPIHVSGWDMAEGKPKRTSRMVPTGAVYFFERADHGPFNEVDAKSLWLAALGQRTEEGFGRVVPGVWQPQRKNS